MAHRGLIAVLWAAAVVAAIMVIGRPAAAQIDQEVTVRVRGTTGEEIVRLHTDTDQVLLEQQVPTGWVDLNAVVPAGTVDLYVAFVNDGRTSTGADRNLLVDHVRWGADLVEAESVEGRGVWDGTRCDALAFHSSEFLACNGFFRFPVPDAVPGGIAYAIEVVARGSTGSEIMQLELNGNVVAEWQVSTDWMPYSPRYTGP